MHPGESRSGRQVPARAARLLAKARDAFYERRYEEAVERCQEALLALLPESAETVAGAPVPTPEDQAARFLGLYAGQLPLLEAERIAGVFTFFIRRKTRFRHDRGRPLPRRDWWEFLQVSREEASDVLTATRLALEAVQRGAPPGP